MSYSPSPPEDEPLPRFWRPLGRWAVRFNAFCAKRPAAAWFRIWLACTALMVFMFLGEGTDAFKGHGATVPLIGLLGWIIPLVIFIKQRKVENDG